MRAACDQSGPGEFVHPSLGSLTGNITGPSFAETLRGRVVQFEFTFIQTDLDAPIYPDASTSTQGNVFAAADYADAQCAADFIADITAPIALGLAVVQGVVGTVVGAVAIVVGTEQAVVQMAEQAIALPGEILSPILAGIGQIVGTINDAAIFTGAVLGLDPPSGCYYGRYAATGLTTLPPVTATVDSQLDASVAAVAACQDAAGQTLMVAGTAPLALPAAVQALVAAQAEAIPSPADQLRLLAGLAGYQVTPAAATAPIGAAVVTVQVATAALIRRAALTALARAEAAYQPTSYDDAEMVRVMLTALLDAEILLASDVGDIASFNALRALRAAIVLDLVTRGSALPRVTTVTRMIALPSLTLAWQLYGDASRSDDLIARVDCPHPGFFPRVFEALSY
jgi:prophage DNA circulation protein